MEDIDEVIVSTTYSLPFKFRSNKTNQEQFNQIRSSSGWAGVDCFDMDILWRSNDVERLKGMRSIKSKIVFKKDRGWVFKTSFIKKKYNFLFFYYIRYCRNIKKKYASSSRMSKG